MSRFLLDPCNNTLSHIGKCLALRALLQARGHEALVTVSPARAAFLDRMGIGDAIVLPDIQEADHRAAPGFAWFRPERIEACVRAEVELLKRLKPDSVLGVFRFTAPLSAHLSGIPYDSLICGSMTPACEEVLGFGPGEPGAEEQAAALRYFRSACAHRIAPALARLGLDPVEDVWQLLLGRRTFLWDFPEFQPLGTSPGYLHVGPVHWPGWPQAGTTEAALDRLEGPMAFVAFGTGGVSARMLRYLIDILWRMGYSVALAMGGQAVADLPAAPGRLASFEFLPVEQALARAALVVCHGGQGLVFEAMGQQIPVFVLPLQPEQAQNGACVERMGCGRRLVRGLVYRGDPGVVEEAFLARPRERVAGEMAEFLAAPDLPARLQAAAGVVRRYYGVEALADALDQAP